MNAIKNKKGFTLIELLAVIVVLAIVMVLATTTVLPYMENARMKTFAVEANEAINAASEVMTLKVIGSITPTDLGENGDDYQSYTDGNYCFSLTKLVDLGIWKKDKKDIGADHYEGYVQVITSNPSKAYVYKVKMHNESLYITNGEGGTATEDMVKDWTKGSEGDFVCPTTSGAD